MRTGPHALTPANLIRNGFDWSGKSGRLPYILVNLSVIALALLIPTTRNFSGANTAVFVALTMVFPIWLGHTRRRLRDVGWSGWLMWLAVLPVFGLFLSIFLAFKPGVGLGGDEDAGYSRLSFVVALACGAMMLSRAFWAPYWIPAASMKPSLMVGDFIAAVPLNTPARGDILVFQHPTKGGEWIQRLIGMPGDTVQMIDGAVYLNSAVLPQQRAGDYSEVFAPQGPMRSTPRCSNSAVAEGAACLKTQLIETLPGGRRHDVLNIAVQNSDNTEIFTVPEGHYFFLGDNRDNALDSRYPQTVGGVGFVPRENITGRAARVLFSSAGDSLLHVWTWRSDRYFKRIQ